VRSRTEFETHFIAGRMPSWLRESRCLYEGGRGTAGTWSAKKTRRKNFSSRNDACKDRFESRRGAPRNRKERMGVQGRFRMGGMRSLRSQQAVVSFAGNRVRRNHLGVKIIRKRDDRKEKREDANDGDHFHPAAVRRMLARPGPPVPPETDRGHGDRQPDEIKESLHRCCASDSEPAVDLVHWPCINSRENRK